MSVDKETPRPSLESSDPIRELEQLAEWFRRHGNEEKAQEILSQLQIVRAKFSRHNEKNIEDKT